MKRDAAIRIFSLLFALAVAVPAVQAALVVDAGGDRTVFAGEPVTVLAACNDTDVLDTRNMSASIDWSTGTTEAEIVPDDDHNATVRGTCTYPVAGTYAVTVTVANNVTGAVACDTLNVTVSPQSAEVKVVPKTLNRKSNGIMTVFVSLADWLGFARSDPTNVTAPDPSAFALGNATPEKVNFCMKDGGTLILKYRRADLDLADGDGSLTVTGNVTTASGPVSVAGSGSVSVINPGNTKKTGPGNNGEYAEAAKVKENANKKVKDMIQKNLGGAEQRPNGKAKGQAP